MTGRILFVDDEPRVLEGLENLLFDIEDWEFEFAGGGEEALARLREQDFDVLVTDMCMPGMDGAELLKRTRHAFPSVIRVVLSGHIEQEAAARAMPFAHEFLSKPCDVDMLVRVLQRALRLTNRFADQALRTALGVMESLPARPETHLRLTDAIEADAGVEEIAKIISTEVALVAKVLQVANTAFYARGHRVTTVQQAVALLGLEVTSAVILAVASFEELGVPPWLGIDYLHRHSTQVGVIAAQLAPPEQSASALLAGMLHDVGQLVLAVYFAERAQQAHALAERGTERTLAERSILGFDHAMIGGYLIRLWNLPDDIARAVEHHHQSGLTDRSSLDHAVFAAEWAVQHPDAGDWDCVLSDDERERVALARALE